MPPPCCSIVLAANNAITIWLNEEKSSMTYSLKIRVYNKMQAVHLQQNSQQILIINIRKNYGYKDEIKKYSMPKGYVLELFLSSSLYYFFLVFSAPPVPAVVAR